MTAPRLLKVRLLDAGWLNKYELLYDMGGGRKYRYEAVSRKRPAEYAAQLGLGIGQPEPPTSDAVCIVARTPRDTLLLVKEFRYALNSWCIGFPAGLVDVGEDVEDAVRRELREETGYGLVEGGDVEVLPQPGVSSVGMGDEAVTIVYCRAEKDGGQQLEQDELIELFELPIDDIGRFLDENELPIGARAQLILRGFSERR